VTHVVEACGNPGTGVSDGGEAAVKGSDVGPAVLPARIGVSSADRLQQAT
jgi:hypothetical protein